MRCHLLLSFIFYILWLLSNPLLVKKLHAQELTQRTAFAVVIGNNHSLNGRRPDLHYADDDAAKYFDILKTIAPGRVHLLANFDSDTQRLFKESYARASAPTRAALQRIGQRLAKEVSVVQQRGIQVDLYFIFAGHGDIDKGSGFIELVDGRFTSRDLENWLGAIPFTRAHVILDSCNSFFMLGVRSPGGRYYATSEDAVHALASRLPNVGVFLSTSAEGEAFEWSELQSGIFSHIVRSGLLGAADANADGAVDYIELAAFVKTATSDVANPNMRPHVFARGPGGRDDVPIVFTRGRTDTRTLTLSDARNLRVRLRDREAVPLLDTHTEAGSSFRVVLPQKWADGAILERALVDSANDETQLFTLPSNPSHLQLASLPITTARGSARGPAEIFQTLFMRPFGPRAVSAYLAEKKTAKPDIYGVSHETVERVDLLLTEIDSAEYNQRLLTGSAMIGGGLFIGMFGASMLILNNRFEDLSRKEANIWGGVYTGIGALYALYGGYTLLNPWSGERLLTDYRAVLTQGDDARAFALLNDRLSSLAAAESRNRWIRGIFGGLLATASAAIWVYGELDSEDLDERLKYRAYAGTGTLLGLTFLGASILIESPIERLLNVLQHDQERLRLDAYIAPKQDGALLGISGQF